MSNMKRRQRNNKGKNNYNDQKDVEAADDNDVGKHISTDFVKNQNTYLRLLFMVGIVATCIGLIYGMNMSYNGNWCHRTEVQVHRQCNLMKDIIQILKNNNFESWLCYGSALAAYRDNGKPMPWEIDDDICIMSDDLEEIEKILVEKSKELNIRVEIPDDFGVVAMKVFFKPLTENGNDNIIDGYPAGEYNIDFYAHKEKTYWGKIKMVQNIGFVRDRYKRDVPASVLKPFKQLNYCGEDTIVNVPGNISVYLSHLYGTEFRRTQKLVSNNGFRGWRCIFSFS